MNKMECSITDGEQYDDQFDGDMPDLTDEDMHAVVEMLDDKYTEREDYIVNGIVKVFEDWQQFSPYDTEKAVMELYENGDLPSQCEERRKLRDEILNRDVDDLITTVREIGELASGLAKHPWAKKQAN